MPSYNITINPLYKELSADLGHPHFMHDGGVLGFVCHHKYVYTDLNKTSSLPHLLKGADQIVYSVAKSLCLSVVVKPVVNNNRLSNQILLECFPEFNIDDCFDEHDHQCGAFSRLFKSGHHIKNITWCQTLDNGEWQVAGCSGTYEKVWRISQRREQQRKPNINPIHFHMAVQFFGGIPQFGIDVYYQIPAILVGIPEWGDNRKGCGTTQRNDSLMLRSEEILDEFCFHGDIDEVFVTLLLWINV